MPLADRLADAAAAFGNRRRTGPVDPRAERLMHRCLDMRQRLRDEADPATRAFLMHAMAHLGASRAQLFQDTLPLHVLGAPRDGFFVEFGATDGLSLSNTAMLEAGFGWRGILAEPARRWHDALRRNRPGAAIETDCVWERTGEHLRFAETAEGELSTLARFAGGDGHARARRGAAEYDVPTVSLDDLLLRHGAPKGFAYLSVDTEGSELAILSAFDLEGWRPQVVTVEHNYTANRTGIHARMTGAGYRRVLEGLSLFDDWYLAPGVTLPQG
ncbi:MAG: FkbM family methyltransferase [Gemmobacter sp.]